MCLNIRVQPTLHELFFDENCDMVCGYPDCIGIRSNNEQIEIPQQAISFTEFVPLNSTTVFAMELCQQHSA